MATAGFYWDNVQESTTTTGTGTITLAGASSGYQAFSTVIPSTPGTQWVYYRLTSGTLWEVGYGLYTESSTTLTRPAANVTSGSSGAGTLITLAGTSTVAIVQPSESIADMGMTASFTMHTVPQ